MFCLRLWKLVYITDKEMSSMKQNFLFLLLLFLISGGNKLAMLVLHPMKHVQSCKLSPGKTEAMKLLSAPLFLDQH